MGRIAAVALLLGWGCLAVAQDVPVRLERVEVRDPAMNGEIAFTLLAPAGWEVDAGVEWRPHQANGAVFSVRVATPDGRVQVEIFPVVPCVWTEADAATFDAAPRGDARLGRLVHPPLMDAADYLGAAILPLHRHDVEPRLLDRQPLDAVARTVSQMIAGPGAVTEVVAERVRAGYEHEGQAYEEDFYVVLVFRFEDALGVPAVLWEAQQQYAVSAPAGELDAYAPLLHAVAASVRVTRAWYAGYLATIRAAPLADPAAIDRLADASYERTRQIALSTGQAIGDSTGAMQTVADPVTGEPLQLPRVVAAWVSDAGDYVLTNDPDYDPHVSDGASWRRIDPADPTR